jgi:hypothetical protein
VTRDQEREVAAGCLAGCLKTVQSIRKLAFRKPFLMEIGFSDRIRLVLVWKLRRAAFHSRRAVGRYGNLPYFPDRN